MENRSLLAGDFGFINAMGGTSSEFARSVVIDATGNSYVTGEFRGTVNFNPQGTFNLTAPGTLGVPDCFIAKYSPTGAFLWAKQIGNTGNDWGNDIALDPSGNLYVAGMFAGTVDFNPDPAVANNRTNVGAADAFLLKLDANGNFLSVGTFGGLNGETVTAISVDSSGNVYTTGQYNGTADFDPTLAGTSNLTSTGGTFDAFLTKISPSGSLLWARGFGGATTFGNGDISNDIAVDASGNAYVTGRFRGTADMDPGPGVTSLTSVGEDDMYISKFDTSGNFVWVRVQAGSAESQALGIAIDNEGNVVTTGEFQSTIDFDPGVGQVNLTAPNGFYGAFVSKLDPQGNYLWAVKLGGPSSGANAYALAIDNNGDIYTTGQFSGTGDFDPSSFPANMTAPGSVDVYVSRLDKGGRFVDARRMGGLGLDRGRAIAIDPLTKAIYTAGQFASTADFDPGPGTVNRTSVSGTDDIFLSKLIQSDISGRVWNDLNQNGLQDGGEPGISGARLEVVAAMDGVFGNNDDRAIGDLVSDASGNFRFTVPHAAAYAFRVYAPTGDGKGYRFTSANSGDDNLDSDVSVSDGTILFTNTAGQSISNFGAGLVEVSSNVELALSIGGPGEQRGRSVAIDAAGNTYVAGTFTTDSIDLDPGPGAFILTNRGADDGFLAKYTADGDFLWAKGLGSTLSDSIAGVAVDSAGNVFVAGSNGASAYFGPGSGETILSSNGQRDLFVAKLSSAGSILWAQRVGSSGDDGASALALDGSGNVYLTGSVNGLVDFDPGPGVIQPPSGTINADSFVWKLNTSGAALWAVRTTGAGIDVGNSIVVAGSSVYVTGQFQSTVDFDPSAATVNRISAGLNDAFLWQLSTANGSYQNSYATGAAGNDFGTGITADSDGNIYLTGTFENTVDFNPSPTLTAFQTATGSDVFVTKSTGAGILLWAKSASGGGADVSGGISVDQFGNVWMTGRFVGAVDFDPSPTSLLLTSTSGSADSFVWGLDAQGTLRKAYQLGGAGFDSGAAVVVTPSGDRVYSTGEFAQQADFDPRLGLINLISFATASPASTQNAYLWVLGLNYAPTDIALSGQTVIEQSNNGTLIGNLSAIDPDPADSQSFTLLDSAEGRFAILGSQLVVADGALLDYESQTSHVITIRATDTLGASFVKSFTITVLNQNEAPFSLALDNQSVPENIATGTVVGQLSASDVDAGDVLSYSLVDNAGGRFAVVGSQLV
ncbi:MAG: SBBP repeat-containing protein, partial [Planctomycetales bacterium]|nr:SBBP repeat-containing protein [Planctomycetales bacterium]